ncbi:MAG: hypothetical protein U1E31_01350 [Rickettsiales bacterium]
MLKIKYMILIIFIVIINLSNFIISNLIYTNIIYASTLKYLIDRTKNNQSTENSINLNNDINHINTNKIRINTAILNNNNLKLSGALRFFYHANMQNISINSKENKNIFTFFKDTKENDIKLNQYFNMDLKFKIEYIFPNEDNSILNKKIFFTFYKDPEVEYIYKNIIAFQAKTENIKIITGYNYSVLKNLIVLASDISENDCSEFIFINHALKKFSIKNFANFVLNENLNTINSINFTDENLIDNSFSNNNIKPISFGMLFKKNNFQFGFNYIYESCFYTPILYDQDNFFNIQNEKTILNNDINIYMQKIYYKHILELGINHTKDFKNTTIKYGFFFKKGQNDNNRNITTISNIENSLGLDIYNFGFIINKNNFSISNSISYFGSNLLYSNLNNKSLDSKKNNFAYHLGIGYRAWNISLSSTIGIQKYNNLEINSLNLQSSCKFQGFNPFISYTIYKINDQNINLNLINNKNINTSLVKLSNKVQHLFILGLKISF